MKMFEMQFDCSRIVEIGRKVLRGDGSHPALAENSISNFRREALNALRTPWFFTRQSGSACKSARLRTEHKQ